MTNTLVGIGHGPVSPCYWCRQDVTGVNGVIVHVSNGEARATEPFRHNATTDTQVQYGRAIDRVTFDKQRDDTDVEVQLGRVTTYGDDGWPV